MNTQTNEKIAPSPYQQAIIDWTRDGKGSAICKARAGSGKTKTIELCLPEIPESKYVSVMAFNKRIAEELNTRLANLRLETGRPFTNFRAQTFHSTGVGAVARKIGLPVKQLMIDDRKCLRLAEKQLTQDDFEMYGSFAAKLVGYAKGEGVGVLCADSDDEWYRIMRHHDLSLESEEANEQDAVAIAGYLLEWSNNVSKGGSIDYDDMLYLPLLWNLRFFQLDWVMVDEAQDTNPVRRALVKKMLRPGGRSMWVGDDKQAIYGFTGASNDALDIIKREFATQELPLTICYRCSKSVIELAQSIVPDIEWHDAAPQGSVQHLDADKAWPLLTDQDAILCRNVAPLIQQAYAFIAAGRGCVVLGRDIGQGLVNLVKKMRARDIDQLEEKLIAYKDREHAKFMARGEEQKAERVADTVECIVIIIANLTETERAIPKMIARIESLFSDDTGSKLTLSTIHKFKGSERPTIAILRPDLMPSKYARQEWQAEQEENLRYVAYTRAQQHLIIVNPPPKATR